MTFHTIVGGILQQNAYLYGDEEGLFLIDPGSHAAEWIAYLNENNLKLTAILLTHGHFDHVGAVDALRDALGVPLWMHEDDSIMLSDFAWRGGHNKMPLRPADRFLKDGEPPDIHGGAFATYRPTAFLRGTPCLKAPSVAPTSAAAPMAKCRTALPVW